MGSAVDMLEPSEATMVARVALRNVHRVIDEHLLPEGFFSLDDVRRVAATACALIAFEFDSVKRLTSESVYSRCGRLGRASTDSAPRPRGDEDWIVRDDFLTIDLAPFVRWTQERMERLETARKIVVSDPDVLGRAPVVRGTRIPVHDVAASMAAGLPMDRILGAYPPLDADKIDLAVIYAEANSARAARERAMNFPGAPSSSPIGGRLAAGRPDEILGRQKPVPRIDQARSHQGIWRVDPCRSAGARRSELGAEASHSQGRLDLPRDNQGEKYIQNARWRAALNINLVLEMPGFTQR